MPLVARSCLVFLLLLILQLSFANYTPTCAFLATPVAATPIKSSSTKTRVALSIRAGSSSGSTHSNNSLMKRSRSSSDDSSNGKSSNKRFSIKSLLAKRSLAVWSVFQVVCLLANAIKRLIPIAAEPILQNDLLPWQWTMYVGFAIFMAYTEGYKAFQLKFSPLVVQRAFGLSDQTPNLFNYILSGPYAMGLFGATKKRMIVSWSVTIFVLALVPIVKRLPYPYRAIVDAGVIVGLSYGALATIWQTIRGLCGVLPNVDPCLPPSQDEGAGADDNEKKK